MTIHEAIEQLESLLDHCKTMCESGEVWVRDCEALDVAIAVLSGTYRDDSSQKIITNADHIRAMNDEELACQLVIDVNGLEPCTLYLSAPTGKMYLIRTDAANKVKEWLQQPYKTED